MLICPSIIVVKTEAVSVKTGDREMSGTKYFFYGFSFILIIAVVM